MKAPHAKRGSGQNQISATKHQESTFRSHMSRKAALKSAERVSPLMKRTCFICETSSRYGRARPQAQMVPPSQPPPQSRPVYEDVKLAEGSRAASAREVAHTDRLFHPCLMIHYRRRTCSGTFGKPPPRDGVLRLNNRAAAEMETIDSARKESAGMRKYIEINIAGGKKLSGFVLFSALLLSVRDEKKPAIDFHSSGARTSAETPAAVLKTPSSEQFSTSIDSTNEVEKKGVNVEPEQLSENVTSAFHTGVLTSFTRSLHTNLHFQTPSVTWPPVLPASYTDSSFHCFIQRWFVFMPNVSRFWGQTF